MESVQEKRLQKLPQAARMEIGQIIGDKRYVSAAAARKQAIEATAREYTVLDPQMLLDDFELQQTAWGDRGDALNQMPSPIYAPNLFANAGLVTFRSQRAGQECPQQEWRNIGEAEPEVIWGATAKRAMTIRRFINGAAATSKTF